MQNKETLEFGNRLKELRKSRSIKQVRLAEMLGITKQAMNAYEAGKYLPDISLILKIADYLNCSIDYLYGRTEHENYEKKVEFDESLSILSQTLCSLPEAVRIPWVDIFVRIAKWIEKDLNGKTKFHTSSIVFFNTFSSLIDSCLTATEMKAQNSYTEEIAQKYRNKRFYLMSVLRKELNYIDNETYIAVEQTIENNQGVE